MAGRAGGAKGRNLGRLMATTALLMAGVIPVAAQQDAKASRPGVSASAYRFDIPAKPLAAAIADVGAVSGWRIAYGFSLPAGSRSAPLSGTMSAPEAIGRLLAGTGISYRVAGNQSIVLSDPKQPATAAGADGATALAPIVVQGQQTGATTEGSNSYRAESVTIAGKIPVSIREIPNSVSVITRQRIADQNLNTVEDTLRQTTGVTATPYGDGTSYFNARGYNLDAQYDGMPVPGGVQYLAQFDMSIYDRVEILRGPAGLLQGSGSPAGAANFVRRMPLDHFAVSTDTQIGSWNFKRQTVDVTGPFNSDGTARGRLIVTGQDRDFFYDDAGEWHGTAYGALQFDLTDKTTLSLSGAYQKQRFSPFDYGQSRYTDGSYLNAPRSAFFGADWSYNNFETSELYANLKHEFDNGWTSNTTLMYRDMRNDSTYAYMYDGVDPATNEAAYAVQGGPIHKQWFGIDTNVSGSFDFLGHESQLLLGANYAYRTSRSEGGFVDAGVVNIYSAPSTVPELDVPYAFGDQSRSNESGVYGQTRLKLLDPLTVVLGGRFSFYSNENRSLVPTTTDWASDPSVNGKFTPYAGVVYDLTDNYSVYASYSDIFQPQTETTVAGGGLQPRVGEQYEVGVKGVFLDGGLTATLAAFNINDNHRAVADPSNPLYSVSAGKARSRGIEAEVTGEVFTGLNLTAGYTYLQTKFLSDPDYQGLVLDPEEPRHTFKLWSKYTFQDDSSLDGVSLGAGMRAYSSSDRGAGTGIDVGHQGGYAVFDAQVGYKINDHAEASLMVKNIFDRTYFDRIPTRYFGIYGEPRSFMVSLKTHW